MLFCMLGIRPSQITSLFICMFFSAPSSKECLVSTSGNDNTENGLSGAKADNKDTPKA